MELDLKQALSILGLELCSVGHTHHISYQMPKSPLNLAFALSSIREINSLIEILEAEGSYKKSHQYHGLVEAWGYIVDALVSGEDR